MSMLLVKMPSLDSPAPPTEKWKAKAATITIEANNARVLARPSEYRCMLELLCWIRFEAFRGICERSKFHWQPGPVRTWGLHPKPPPSVCGGRVREEIETRCLTLWYDGNGKSKQLRRSGIIPSGFCVFGPFLSTAQCPFRIRLNSRQSRTLDVEFDKTGVIVYSRTGGESHRLRSAIALARCAILGAIAAESRIAVIPRGRIFPLGLAQR